MLQASLFKESAHQFSALAAEYTAFDREVMV